MPSTHRTLITLCLLAIAAATAAWLATGATTFTRTYDPAIEQATSSTALRDLFPDTASHDTASNPTPTNRTTLGLFPSAAPPSRESLSLLTLALPAAALLVTTLIHAKRTRSKAS